MKSAGGDQNIQKGLVKWWEDQGVLYCWGGGEGGHSRKVWVELCHRGLQTLILFKTKTIPSLLPLLHDPYSVHLAYIVNLATSPSSSYYSAQFIFQSDSDFQSSSWTFFLQLHLASLSLGCFICSMSGCLLGVVTCRLAYSLKSDQ